MALLQIAEPGQSTVPHEHRLAAGIDLGTTNSLIASVKSGLSETLVDNEGQDILPSIVSYQENDILVGNAAKAHSVSDQKIQLFQLNVSLDIRLLISVKNTLHYLIHLQVMKTIQV